jgi:hypothetical protein
MELDETKLCAFFVAITAFSLFMLCFFFLDGEKSGKGRVLTTKKITEFRFIMDLTFLSSKIKTSAKKASNYKLLYFFYPLNQ